MKDKQYEEFIQKIGDKVNTAKNFKMYGLQSNRRLIYKIAKGGIERFTSHDSDSKIDEVFSSKSLKSSNLNSTNDRSTPKRRFSDEKSENISNDSLMSIKRN